MSQRRGAHGFDAPLLSKAGAEDERGRSDPPAACRDTTPHKTRFVRMEAGVWLDVLDWGGEHQPRTMVLHTGLGDSAWAQMVAWHKDTIDRFASGNPTPTLRLHGAPHYVYINNETEVVREMRKLLGLTVDGS